MSEPIRLAPFDVFVDPLLGFHDRRLREMQAYWDGKRHGRTMPARVDVSPAEIVSHLPSVFLVNVAPPMLKPEDFTVRLMGTALNELFAHDFTGRSFAEVLSARPSSAFCKLFGIVAQLRRPIRIYGHSRFAPGGPVTEVEGVLLPLSGQDGGDTVGLVMGELVKRASSGR